MIPPDFVSIRVAYSKFAIYGTKAAGHLKYYLVTDNLHAYYVDSRAETHLIAPDFWQSKTDDVCQIIFVSGEATYTEDATSFPIDTDIVVRDADLAAILPATNNAAHADPMEADSATRRGRPPEFDWDAVWAGIVQIVNDEGLPKTKEEMIEKVAEWYNNSFGPDTAPERSTLQPRITKLYELLYGGEPSRVFRVPSKRKTRRPKHT
jgi:hypothetical protein